MLARHLLPSVLLAALIDTGDVILPQTVECSAPFACRCNTISTELSSTVDAYCDAIDFHRGDEDSSECSLSSVLLAASIDTGDVILTQTVDCSVRQARSLRSPGGATSPPQIGLALLIFFTVADYVK
ncbi:unnamed protein product [Nippostrongylus brasiliensis]|uniref:CFEM domain-containing protein n=1 Tax=Nippostrongylus brasiliensis TaxID=27835 RepID=A0A0N4XUK2_NIPBR|nr:unnamed protein product [Nippostrongylus brasiliensis]